MKVLVLGADGYLGWPTSMSFANKGHSVVCVDNFSKRRICENIQVKPLVELPTLKSRVKLWNSISKNKLKFYNADITEYTVLKKIVRNEKPDVIIHYAEQPSGPYSLIGQPEGEYTLVNNLVGTHNILWAMVEEARDAHLIKLGTAGEYGESNVDIPEGWLEYTYKGRADKRLFPRQAGSLYHTTKVLDTDLIWFFVRMFDLKVSDIMQGPVYGQFTAETDQHDLLNTAFYYDDVFGTVVNRFVAQAAAGIPLTVYGEGGQTRGYINLYDVMQCISLVAQNPPENGELSIYNQVTETLSVNQIAERVKYAASELNMNVEIQNIENPRKEAENHYYNMENEKLKKLGLEPHIMTTQMLVRMLHYANKYKDHINEDLIYPRVSWHK